MLDGTGRLRRHLARRDLLRSSVLLEQKYRQPLGSGMPRTMGSMMRRALRGRYSVAMAAAGAGALVAVAIAAFISPGADDAEGIGSFTGGTVSILERPATPADRLPERVLNSPFPETQLNGVENARLAQTASGRGVFVAPGKGDKMCLIVMFGDAVGATCGDRRALANIPIYLARPNGNGTQDVVGLVADGVTSVGDARVIANTFAMNDAQSGVFEMHSAAGSRSVVIGAE